MSQAKALRPSKRQLGQFMTPPDLARQLVDTLRFDRSTRVIEPGFGDGSFVLPLIERFLALYDGPIDLRLERVLTDNVFGYEIDPCAYERCLAAIARRWGKLPQRHNLIRDDFFRYESGTPGTSAQLHLPLLNAHPAFDLIVGNPPFGGSIDPELQDVLDRRYGFRNGEKIKKETYSFFLVKCLDLLAPEGKLIFICSDTFLTIRTMRGLRKLLLEHSRVRIRSLPAFSDETSYPMVVLELEKTGRSDAILIDGREIAREVMELTGNFSWAIDDEFARYFRGPLLGDFVVCSSGMTIGKNDLFVRAIVDGAVIEPYDFEFFDEPITVERERQRARLHKLSSTAVAKIALQERQGLTRRNVRAVPKQRPLRIELPHPDYRYYNKSNGGLLFSPPTNAVFWRDNGDAVITFKKNGNWYLHGVGGRPFFGRSGITWQLVAARLNPRFLPEGYILDSGAPCAFLRTGVESTELLFILGWTATELCTRILKTVINHTMNIQGKDFERLPYPFWVDSRARSDVIAVVGTLLQDAMAGTTLQRGDPALTRLERLFAFPDRLV